MKKHSLITALSMALASWGMTALAAPAIYCVHDKGLNDSQFCVGYPLPFPSNGIVPMGPLYQNCDIEALDLDEDGEDPLCPPDKDVLALAYHHQKPHKG